MAKRTCCGGIKDARPVLSRSESYMDILQHPIVENSLLDKEDLLDLHELMFSEEIHLEKKDGFIESYKGLEDYQVDGCFLSSDDLSRLSRSRAIVEDLLQPKSFFEANVRGSLNYIEKHLVGSENIQDNKRTGYKRAIRNELNNLSYFYDTIDSNN